MKVISREKLVEIIHFFDWVKNEIYQDHRNKGGVDVQIYAEKKGVDLEEYMGIVKEMVESNPTNDRSTYLYSVQSTILPIYEYRDNKLLVNHSDLRCITRGIGEIMKKERDLGDLV